MVQWPEPVCGGIYLGGPWYNRIWIKLILRFYPTGYGCSKTNWSDTTGCTSGDGDQSEQQSTSYCRRKQRYQWRWWQLGRGTGEGVIRSSTGAGIISGAVTGGYESEGRKVMKRCICDMKKTSPHCNFRTALFAISTTYVYCDGRTGNVKTCMCQTPQTLRQIPLGFWIQMGVMEVPPID